LNPFPASNREYPSNNIIIFNQLSLVHLTSSALGKAIMLERRVSRLDIVPEWPFTTADAAKGGERWMSPYEPAFTIVHASE
jgi:hypothetical protein